MMRRGVGMMRLFVCTVVFMMWTVADVMAQQFPERRHIRGGNRDYEAQDYQAAEQAYRTAAIKNQQSVEAEFNLADALYRQGRHEEAENALKNLTKREGAMTVQQAAQAHYNLGNAQFAQQKLQEALESYKQSLRLNPDDVEAKFNYAYTKKLLEQNQNNNQQNQNQNQDQDQNQNQNNENNNQNDQNNPDQNQNDSDQNQDNQQNQDNPDQNDGQNNDENQSDSPDNEGQAPPQKSGMSQQEAEQILNAIQGQEDKTREKMDAQKAVTVGRSGKNW